MIALRIRHQTIYAYRRPVSLGPHGFSRERHSLRTLRPCARRKSGRGPAWASAHWNRRLERRNEPGRRRRTRTKVCGSPGYFMQCVRGVFADGWRPPCANSRFVAPTQDEQLASSVDRYGWDGDWYFPAASSIMANPWAQHAIANRRIDSLAQSWAVLSGMAAHRGGRSAVDGVRLLALAGRNIRAGASCLLRRLTTPCPLRVTLWAIRPAFAKTAASTRTRRPGR